MKYKNINNLVNLGKNLWDTFSTYSAQLFENSWTHPGICVVKILRKLQYKFQDVSTNFWKVIENFRSSNLDKILEKLFFKLLIKWGIDTLQNYEENLINSEKYSDTFWKLTKNILEAVSRGRNQCNTPAAIFVLFIFSQSLYDLSSHRYISVFRCSCKLYFFCDLWLQTGSCLYSTWACSQCMPQVVCAVYISYMVQCGFIRAQVYSQH